MLVPVYIYIYTHLYLPSLSPLSPAAAPGRALPTSSPGTLSPDKSSILDSRVPVAGSFLLLENIGGGLNPTYALTTTLDDASSTSLSLSPPTRHQQLQLQLQPTPTFRVITDTSQPRSLAYLQKTKIPATQRSFENINKHQRTLSHVKKVHAGLAPGQPPRHATTFVGRRIQQVTWSDGDVVTW